MGQGGMYRAACILLPVIIYCSLAYALMILGVYALFEDHAVTHNACNNTYHFSKYGFLNLVLWLFATVSYCVWKGGGEGARVRALTLTILYFAFFTWGVLLWQNISDICIEVMDKQFHVMFLFHHASTGMNGITAFMFLFHEAFIGKYVGADLTVMADVTTDLHKPHAPDRIPGTPVMHGPTQQSMLQNAHPPSNLSPQLSYEYEKIMQNNSSSILPQTTP